MTASRSIAKAFFSPSYPPFFLYPARVLKAGSWECSRSSLRSAIGGFDSTQTARRSHRARGTLSRMKGTWIVVVASVAAVAHGNDADVSFGGSPKLLSGKTAVRMIRESISMNVDQKTTKVVCDF